MSIPKEAFEPASHYYGLYGLYGFGCSRVKPVFSTGANLTPAPADSIPISLEFLRGVEAAAKYAHDNYEEPEWTDIANTVIAVEVARLRKEATK